MEPDIVYKCSYDYNRNNNITLIRIGRFRKNKFQGEIIVKTKGEIEQMYGLKILASLCGLAGMYDISLATMALFLSKHFLDLGDKVDYIIKDNK